MDLDKIQAELETRVDLTEAINSLKVRFTKRHSKDKPTGDPELVFYNHAEALFIVTMSGIGKINSEYDQDGQRAFADSLSPFRAIRNPTAILAMTYRFAGDIYVLGLTIITPIGTANLKFPYRFKEELEWFTTDVTLPEMDPVFERVLIHQVNTIPFFSLKTALDRLANRGAEVQYLVDKARLNDYIFNYVPGDERM